MPKSEKKRYIQGIKNIKIWKKIKVRIKIEVKRPKK